MHGVEWVQAKQPPRMEAAVSKWVLLANIKVRIVGGLWMGLQHHQLQVFTSGKKKKKTTEET